MKYIKLIAILIIASFTNTLSAQSEIGLHFMPHLWQANKTNPAIVSKDKLTISLPGLRNNLFFTGPTYNQIVQNQDGESVIDIDKLVSNLEPENLIRDELEIETLGAALNIGKLTLSLGHSIKYNAYLEYPKTLPQVIWQGNAQFIGETVSLGNNLQLAGYNEFALGVAYKFGKITLGGKAKYLTGISSVSTDKDQRAAELFTDPEFYQLQLSGNYLLRSAGSFDYQNYNDFDLNFNFGQIKGGDLFTGNSGLAFDFGARLELGKWDISASILDLGSIDWKEDVRNYATTGNYEYDGLDISQALTGESVNFNDALDTLEQIFQVVENNATYTTDLSTKIYLSASYQLSETLRVGGVFFNEKIEGENYPVYGIGVSAKVLPSVTVGGSYSIVNNQEFTNIGLNAVGDIGPVQVFAVTDNIIAAFKPGDARSFSARIGVNITLAGSEPQKKAGAANPLN